jgi:non-ribosomal peptide synthetase component F
MPEVAMDWSVTSMDIGSGGSPWDLYLAFINRSSETTVRVQYNPDLFDAATITRMITDYEALLDAVKGNPEARISQLDLSMPVGPVPAN